jgi:hypothetical protein
LPEGVEILTLDPRAFSSAPFLVVGVFTPAYQAKADRLMASCRALRLAGVFYRSPLIHNSVSPTGVADPAFTKPRFISQALETFGKPVLYLDADMVVKERPELFRTFPAKVDLAIYNWFGDRASDAWQPMEVTLPDGTLSGKRFWRLRNCIDYHDPAQLLASGATQFWNRTRPALELLEAWRQVLADFPGTADDECLDFAFNNRVNAGLRTHWLEKKYARYPWWPHVKPVIDHPDDVTALADRTTLAPVDERRRHYLERMETISPPANALPRWAVLDLEKRLVLRVENGRFAVIGDLTQRFWV